MGWKFTTVNGDLRPEAFWGLTRKGLRSKKLEKNEQKRNVVKRSIVSRILSYGDSDNDST